MQITHKIVVLKNNTVQSKWSIKTFPHKNDLQSIKQSIMIELSSYKNWHSETVQIRYHTFPVRENLRTDIFRPDQLSTCCLKVCCATFLRFLVHCHICRLDHSLYSKQKAVGEIIPADIKLLMCNWAHHLFHYHMRSVVISSGSIKSRPNHLGYGTLTRSTEIKWFVEH